MKALVFITQFYQVSGSEKLAIELARGLAQRGFDVDLLSMYSNDRPEIREAEQALRGQGIENFLYLDLSVNPGVTEVLSGIVRLRRLLRQVQYHFVETSFIGPMTLLCWARLGLPTEVLGGIHAVYDVKINNSFKLRLWRRSVQLSRKLKCYAISNAVKETWSRYAAIPLERIRVIENAIEDSFFEVSPAENYLKNELGIPADRRVLLFVGSILWYKGLDVLVDAVGPRLEPRNLHLLVVGEAGKHDTVMPAEVDIEKDIAAQIDAHGWSDRISFLGNRTDVAQLMASSDLLVHPARTEGFGLVLAEAMAAGLPIVATDVGGIPEVLSGTRSLQVPPDNPDRLGEAIDSMLDRDARELAQTRLVGKACARRFKMARRIDELLDFGGLLADPG